MSLKTIPVLFISYLLLGTGCLCFLGLQGYRSVMLGFFIYGAHRGALEPVQRAFVAELAPRQYRSSVLGGFQMVIGLCAFPASLLAGFLWDSFGSVIPLYCSLMLTVSSMVVLFFVKETRGNGTARGMESM